MRILISSMFLFLLFAVSCTQESIDPNTPVINSCAFEEADTKVWTENGKTYLWGGENDTMHFDIIYKFTCRLV